MSLIFNKNKPLFLSNLFVGYSLSNNIIILAQSFSVIAETSLSNIK